MVVDVPAELLYWCRFLRAGSQEYFVSVYFDHQQIDDE
jgi:hypothetical protein